MKTVLIFGINGFVGRYLADEFFSNGYCLAGADRVSSCLLPSVKQYFEVDLTDASAVDHAICALQPDCIVNLAAISSVGQSWCVPQTTIEVNVVGVINILESIKKLKNPPKILLVGSSEEYAAANVALDEESPLRATSPYGASKSIQMYLAEMYAERYGLSIYQVRSFNHTGIGQSDSFVLSSFCKQIAAIEHSRIPGTIYTGNLTVARDFSDVRDVVRAYRMIIESVYAGEIFNVGSGSAHSLSYLLKHLISLCSQEVCVKTDPLRVRSHDVPLIKCDNSKLSKNVGWFPRIPIESTLSEMFCHELATKDNLDK